MSESKGAAAGLDTLDSLSVDVLTDDVSDNYVSKTLFAVSEFSNVVLGGATVISGEALLCANLGIRLGDVEAIAVTHGHWDHMAALPMTIDTIIEQAGRVTVHVNPGMFNERAIRLSSGRIVPVANVPSPAELQQHGATVITTPPSG